MSAVLEVINPGLSTSIQDKGRFGFGSVGVPRSGAIDPMALQLGNALVGNAAFEAALEFRMVAPMLKVSVGSVRVGLACYAEGMVIAEDGNGQPVTAWQSVTLNAGDTLKLRPLSQGVTGYLCIEGGLAIDPVLGSCSTYARAGLGGVNGQGLQAGDRLTTRTQPVVHRRERRVTKPLPITDGALRVLLGPQEDYFLADATQRLVSEPFTVSTDVDRMGIRLQGAALQVDPDKGSDLVSDGIVPGAIQVPGSGQPIMLCVDCQSVGGYPKIATVISADLHHLGQLTPGKLVTFSKVGLVQAQQAHQQQMSALHSSMDSISEIETVGELDHHLLLTENLISGVVDAQAPE